MRVQVSVGGRIAFVVFVSGGESEMQLELRRRNFLLALKRRLVRHLPRNAALQKGGEMCDAIATTAASQTPHTFL